jgi:cellulose synthase/poly-beta-1,6-N-acetylglucosamine synthase-like glycosyltransferase
VLVRKSRLKPKFFVSVGIITYRDSSNIVKLIQSVFQQRLSTVKINEVILVSPKEDELFLRSILKDFKHVKLLLEPGRRGKYSADNRFFLAAKSEILVLCSGDIYLDKDAIENLCIHFSDEKIGFVGSRPIPVNADTSTFIGYSVDLIWKLHHSISLVSPKFGEVMAFRNIKAQIPKTAVDEEQIAAQMLARGYKGHYAADSVIYNKGPVNIADFIKQRRRIYCGHLYLKKNNGYTASSMNNLLILRALWQNINIFRSDPIKLLFAVLLEFVARGLGLIDFIFGREHSKWEIISKF